MKEFLVQNPENSENNPENKKEIYQAILNKETNRKELPEAVFILSGGIKKTGEGKFKTLSYSDEDVHGFVTGGKARVVGAAELAKVFPEMKMVTTSAIEPDFPSHARVMADELIKRETPEDQVILEEKSIDTITELMEMIKMSVRENWKKITILTSDYHIPRTKEMFRQLGSLVKDEDPEFDAALIKFKEANIEINFVSAEEILETTGHHFKSLIDKVRLTEGYKKRLEAEERGLEDLKSGRYKRFKK